MLLLSFEILQLRSGVLVLLLLLLRLRVRVRMGMMLVGVLVGGDARWRRGAPRR